MTTLRTLGSILAGYLAFALLSMTLLGIMLPLATLWQWLVGISGLATIGIVTGIITVAIAGPKRVLACGVVAGLILVATLANMILDLGAEPVWYKAATIIITASAVLAIERIWRKPEASESEVE